MHHKPNIILIVADDIPRNMLGAYGAEGGLSPHLDALARDGLTFQRAYTTAPLCTPSRFSLLTGRYSANASSIAAHRPWNMVGFNTFLTGKEPTLAHRLQRVGYLTCFVRADASTEVQEPHVQVRPWTDTLFRVP
jgi:arylsulfatase A